MSSFVTLNYVFVVSNFCLDSYRVLWSISHFLRYISIDTRNGWLFFLKYHPIQVAKKKKTNWSNQIRISVSESIIQVSFISALSTLFFCCKFYFLEFFFLYFLFFFFFSSERKDEFLFDLNIPNVLCFFLSLVINI